MKAHVTVNSEINYDFGELGLCRCDRHGVETNHQLANDSVMFDIVRKLRSGEAKVKGRSIPVSEGDGKKWLTAEL